MEWLDFNRSIWYIQNIGLYPKYLEVWMNVSDYQFNDQEIARFHQYRDNQDDARLKARFIALLMLAEGIEIHKVAAIIGKSIKTIENWHRQYRSKWIESLNFFQYKPKQSYLNDEQIEQFASWVKTTNPAKGRRKNKFSQNDVVKKCEL